MSTYATPGVYIEEVTGPGVIAGVGTSTVAFIGPTIKGPLLTPRRVTSLDEFIALYGTTQNSRPWPYLFVAGKLYYLGFGVEGFFTNGGQQAYIVRVGTATQASLVLKNRAGQNVFTVQSLQDGVVGQGVQVTAQQYTRQSLATGTGTITGVNGATLTVDTPANFQVGDFVTTNGNNRAKINQISGNNLILDAALAGAALNNTLRIADIIPGQAQLRLTNTAGLSSGTALIQGADVANPATTATERVVIQNINPSQNIVTLATSPARTITYSLSATQSPTLTLVRTAVRGQANVSGSSGTTLTVNAPDQFRPGDVVTSDGTHRAQVTRTQGNNLILDQTLAGLGATLRIADIIPAQSTFRLSDTSGLYPGTFMLLSNDNGLTGEYVVLQAVNGAGFVTLEPTPARASTYSMNVAVGSEPILISQEFRLIVTSSPPAAGSSIVEDFENLSLNPFHPRYIFNTGIIPSNLIEIKQPTTPPTTVAYPDRLLALINLTNLQGGQDDQPSGLTSVDYQAGLDALGDVEDVNMICVPDAASHPERQTIQNAMIVHCLTLRDRVAILDSILTAPPSGPGSVEEQRGFVQSESGFAALYYPWLLVRDPTSTGPQARTMLIPPSGHMAGVYAREDTERGVHKAPANTDVRGVLGLEVRLSDRQQAPLNLKGVNALRIFPGSGQVTVWGARTTVDPNITDWLYVPVRRLMIYIEQSIEVGIRWAVFEPNDLTLWKNLKRTITDFLTRVWRDGGLFGATADKAFYVRIDEALNPPSTRALGRLYIEIGVAPVRPAEFIIVRIGLWDGGSEVSES